LSYKSWIPDLREKVLNEMLGEIGITSIEELFSDIPSEIRKKIDIGEALSEYEALTLIREKLSKNRVFKYNFLGGGVYRHYVPAVVEYVASRGEFYTSYTPYQPEASQGISQALFEYQSLISDLTGMDIVNASMYDQGSALGEAALLSFRVTRRRKIIVPRTMNPRHKRILKTYLRGKGFEVQQVNYDKEKGLLCLEDLENKIDEETAAVYVENPSFLGFIEENVYKISDIVHEKESLFVVGVDLIRIEILNTPSKYEEDIVVAEGQRLGNELNYGGPLLGVLAVREDRRLLHQMPGRIFGVTSTVDGNKRGFIMILQAREQHIRREKATSNICTNQALCALRAAVYLSLSGPEGIRELAENLFYKASYLAKRMNELKGVKAPHFKAPHFREFVATFDKNVEEINKKLLEKGIHGGLSLKKLFPELGNSSLYAVSEIYSRKDLDYFVSVLKEVLA